ncbi:hypothetical protein MKZ38_003388 [Zalerion maritima]|uniref:Uncharacterized protein n=1 Tax=Zalerion maritima TaxID=339359 RepID=A0AAD5RN07_9PEZI|nr:hypothetical protein MKZ38_003388 [Zalerion maritima]
MESCRPPEWGFVCDFLSNNGVNRHSDYCTSYLVFKVQELLENSEVVQADFEYHFVPGATSIEIFAGLLPIDTRVLPFLDTGEMCAYFTGWTTNMLGNPRYAQEMKIDGCDSKNNCTSVFLPGGQLILTTMLLNCAPEIWVTPWHLDITTRTNVSAWRQLATTTYEKSSGKIVDLRLTNETEKAVQPLNVTTFRPNFIGIPVQWSSISTQYANSSEGAIQSSEDFSMSDNMLTRATSGRSGTKLVSKPWTVWVFIGGAGAALGVIGLVLLWMVVRDGASLSVPPGSGVAEMDMLKSTMDETRTLDHGLNESTLSELVKEGCFESGSMRKKVSGLKDKRVKMQSYGGDQKMLVVLGHERPSRYTSDSSL